MKKPRAISYRSAVWDIRTDSIKSARLYILLYEASKPTGIIVWLPGMSDKPIADRNNPLLSYVVPRALKEGFSVAIVCFPGTFDARFIEERTLSTMKQNALDAIKKLSQTIRNYKSLQKILIGRSSGGSLVGRFVDTGFDAYISIAGRIQLRELYKQIQRKGYLCNTAKPYLRVRNPVNIGNEIKYCINDQYMKEIGTEETKIRTSFERAGRQTAKPKLLAIQAHDDNVVPYQLDAWKKLADGYDIPIALFPLNVPCGHSFLSQPVVRLTANRILSFITEKGVMYV
ncbi:MAG TPA: hypothetical protein VJB96_00210 [Patescibacteria group bacterium]|nr:hypothetical protein [Patescibacteria group bacterium]